MYLYIFEDTPFELGTWEVLMWFGAIVVLFLLTVNRPKNFPVGRLGIFLCGLMLAYFGFVGGKILSIILNWQEVSSKGYSLYEIYITSGGAFLGTLYTEILVLIAFTKCRRNKISFLVFSDYMAPFMLLAQAFVRVGCFFNECCYGKVTDLPWGCVFQTVSPEPRHPTQLYEVAYIVLIFLIMRHIYKKGTATGVTFFGSLSLYGSFRFFNEFLRTDSFPVLGVLTLANLSTLTLAIVSAVFLITILKKRSTK